MSSSSSSRWAWRCSSKCGSLFLMAVLNASRTPAAVSPKTILELCVPFVMALFLFFFFGGRGGGVRVYWVTSRLVVILDAYPMRQETHLFSERGTPSYLVGGQNDGKCFPFSFSVYVPVYIDSLCFSKQRLVLFSLVCVGWGVMLSRQSDVPKISDLFLTRAYKRVELC